MAKSLKLVLLGRTGAGKSSAGNTILGRQAFESKKISRSVTQDFAVESGTVGHFPVTVYDTPGFFDTEMSDDKIHQMINENVLQRCESGHTVFLLVIKADRFTEEERKTVEKIEQLLGEERLKKTWILFTRGDELEEENMTIKEFINNTEPLKNLVQKYDQRYCVFNNKNREHPEQVQMLLMKIPHFDTQEGAEILKQNPLMRKKPANIDPDAPVSSPSSRRIVLLGKTGVGKSAAGNTILGQREFNSVMRMSSVTRECSAAHATVSGRSVSVVDTPGLFDTKMKTEELVTEIARSVYISSPGPHTFLIVFPLNIRFTDQEQKIPQQIEMLFGEEVLKYSIILFTHGDLLEDGKSVEKLIEESSRLRDLVGQCGGRYHVFNNRDVNNRDQVNDLLKKIDTMIEENGGGHYSNQMYEDALRFRREEEERKQQKEKRRQEEEKRKQEEIERAIKETVGRFRAEMEAELKTEQERLEVKRQREDEERKQKEKQRREETERVIKETEDEIRARSENKEETGFAKFLSSYWSCILTGATIGGMVGAGVGAVVGAVVGAGAGVHFFNKHKADRKQQEKERQDETERMIKEGDRIRAEMEAQLKSKQERIVVRRQREDEERKQQEKQRRDETERMIKETEESIRAHLNSNV